MKRFLFYSLCVLAFAAATVHRAHVAERDLGKEVASIAGEWRAHGKPVRIAAVTRGDLTDIVKVSGVAAGAGELRADVVPQDAAALRESRSFDGCGIRAVAGSVESVSAGPDIATGLFPVRLRVEKGPVPAPGAIVVACIRRTAAAGVLRVLRPAMQRGLSASVWVDAGGKAEKRRVSTGRSDEDYIEIRHGLKAGERVVVDGWRALSQGDALRVVGEVRP